MAAKATWKAPTAAHGKLDTEEQKELPESAFAFPKQRKEPLTDASHVKNALARFDQVKGVNDEERDRLRELKLEELRKFVAVGIEQADRGEVGPLDVDATLARVRSRKGEARKGS